MARRHKGLVCIAKCSTSTAAFFCTDLWLLHAKMHSLLWCLVGNFCLVNITGPLDRCCCCHGQGCTIYQHRTGEPSLALQMRHVTVGIDVGAIPLILDCVMIAPDLCLDWSIFICLFFLVKGQQLCITLAFLFDSCFGSCFCLLLPTEAANMY